jgi:hypothetical protein
MAVLSPNCEFTGRVLLPRRILGRQLGSFALSSRTLWARCFEGEALLWVYAAKRGNPGIWVLWLVIWRYRILEPALGCNRCYAFLYLRISVATCMHEREGNILVVRM